LIYILHAWLSFFLSYSNTWGLLWYTWSF